MQCLKQCFESKDIALLQKTITEMPEEDARYHMKRCVDSGLWVADASKAEGGEGGTEEEVYDTVQDGGSSVDPAKEKTSTIDDVD